MILILGDVCLSVNDGHVRVWLRGIWYVGIYTAVSA